MKVYKYTLGVVETLRTSAMLSDRATSLQLRRAGAVIELVEMTVGSTSSPTGSVPRLYTPQRYVVLLRQYAAL